MYWNQLHSILWCRLIYRNRIEKFTYYKYVDIVCICTEYLRDRQPQSTVKEHIGIVGNGSLLQSRHRVGLFHTPQLGRPSSRRPHGIIEEFPPYSFLLRGSILAILRYLGRLELEIVGIVAGGDVHPFSLQGYPRQRC